MENKRLNEEKLLEILSKDYGRADNIIIAKLANLSEPDYIESDDADEDSAE